MYSLQTNPDFRLCFLFSSSENGWRVESDVGYFLFFTKKMDSSFLLWKKNVPLKT